MCLGIPGKIITIRGSDPLFAVAVVDFGGVKLEVSLGFLPEAAVGDYCLVHVGIALCLISEERAMDIALALSNLGEKTGGLGEEIG